MFQWLWRKRHIEFRTNRFAQKDTRYKPHVNHQKDSHAKHFDPLKEERQNKISYAKQLRALHKSFEVARSLESLIAETLQYNLFPTNISFDEDYTCKPDKAALVKKLEDWLEKGDLRFSKASSANTAMVVDFISIIRRQSKNMTVFKDIIKLA